MSSTWDIDVFAIYTRVAAIDDDPQRFPGLLDDGSDPLDEAGGKHEFGGKRPHPTLGDLGHRLAADVEHRPQWQSQSTETRMGPQPGSYFAPTGHQETAVKMGKPATHAVDAVFG